MTEIYTEIYIDGDACPVREETRRALSLMFFVVSNGSRPLRPPGTSNVRIVLVDDRVNAADDWIAEHISADDVSVTLISRWHRAVLRRGARRLPDRKAVDASEYR